MRSCAAGDAPVNTIGFARREIVEGATARRGAAVRRGARCRRGRRGAGRRADARERSTCARRSARTGRVLSLVEKATGREALAAPGNVSSSTTTILSRSTPGTSTRHTSRRGRLRRPPTARGVRPRRCARRSRSSGASGASLRRSCGSTPARGGSSSARPSTGTSAHAAEGLLPARRARAERDLRDAVRLRRAADALLDELRPRALRGAGPSVGRPLRARLRRRALDRLEVRLQLSRRTSSGSACSASPKSPDPEADMGRHEFAYALLPHARRLARGGRRRRGCALQRAAPLDCTARRAVVRDRSTTRTSCSTRSSAPRTRTRSCSASTSRTARAAPRACGSARRSRRRAARTRSRKTTATARRSGRRLDRRCRTGRTSS